MTFRPKTRVSVLTSVTLAEEKTPWVRRPDLNLKSIWDVVEVGGNVSNDTRLIYGVSTTFLEPLTGNFGSQLGITLYSEGTRTNEQVIARARALEVYDGWPFVITSYSIIPEGALEPVTITDEPIRLYLRFTEINRGDTLSGRSRVIFNKGIPAEPVYDGTSISRYEVRNDDQGGAAYSTRLRFATDPERTTAWAPGNILRVFNAYVVTDPGAMSTLDGNPVRQVEFEGAENATITIPSRQELTSFQMDIISVEQTAAIKLSTNVQLTPSEETIIGTLYADARSELGIMADVVINLLTYKLISWQVTSNDTIRVVMSRELV